MDKYRSHELVALLMVLAVFILACEFGGIADALNLGPTSTPTSTSTATPRPTATLKPTDTPTPTPTQVPPTSTPAPMGTPVTSGEYEVNVISMRTLNTVYLSKMLQWVPTAGNMFVELGIKVVNSNPGTKVAVPWMKIYVIEQSGNSRSPSWGEFKAVESEVEVNPKSLVFRMLNNSFEQVTFDDAVFIRAIYTTKKHSPTTLLFRFGNAPLIEVVVP